MWRERYRPFTITEKPEAILRFERKHGLKCRKNGNEWDVISPNGHKLFTIGTLGTNIDSVTMPIAKELL